MVSSKGVELLKILEGLRLAAYPDPATGGAPWTHGYGHTRGVKQGDTCTPEQAHQWLLEDAADAEQIIDRHVFTLLSQNQRDALISFVLNVGPGAKGVKDGFVTLKSGQPSTMLKLLQAGDLRGAADEFPKWNLGNGRVMNGLVIRRKRERDLFLSDMAPEAEVDSPIVLGAEINATKESTVAPFLPLAFQAVASVVPDLIKLFGGGSDIAERNAAAVQTVVEAAKAATGATNEQQLIEKIADDPDAAMLVRDAVKAVWWEITPDTSGVEAARKTNAESSGFWHQPAFWIALMLTPLVYFVTIRVLMGDFSAEVQSMVIASIISGVLGAITGYFLGTSFSSSRKTEMMK